nr:hypothetical protein [Actinomyces faecalis]
MHGRLEATTDTKWGHLVGGISFGLRIVGSQLEAEAILLSLWFLREFKEVSGDLGESISYLCRGGVEELSSGVNAVDAFVSEVAVKLRFDRPGAEEAPHHPLMGGEAPLLHVLSVMTVASRC